MPGDELFLLSRGKMGRDGRQRMLIDDGILHAFEARNRGLGGTFVPVVERQGGGDSDDFLAAGIVQPGGSDDGFQTHAAVRIDGGFL